MAETALSMASSMLKSAASKAAAAAAEEISLLMGVRKDMFMKDELETMQAFLEAPEVITAKKDKLVRVWAKQVRDLSCDIEDCLDEFTVHIGSQSLLEKLKKLKDRHRIAVQIRNLKSRVEEVSCRNTRYNLIKTEASNTTDGLESCMEDIRQLSARNIDEAQLVGFDIPKKKLLEMINIHVDDGDARVVCIVGTGGLGKTTLARKIYDSKEDIAKNFSYRAWIIVSQSFFITDLLKDMIRQFFGADALQKCLEQLGGIAGHLKDLLSSYLRERLMDQRYFIVFDDLWDINAWSVISRIALPSNNSKGCRILVTTRIAGLAKECTSESLIYHLEPLAINDAIKLLLSKTGKTQKDIENNENLRNMVTQLVKKCGFLPLAILTIGGILARKKIEEWEKFDKKIPSELESNPSLEATRRIVTLSYDHLPSHLKPCFLYLSIFPEDFEISRRRLIERWIAEGLVKASIGVAVEEVGENYFDCLISRSMIVPSKVNIEGVVKSCWVHDIMRDITISISRGENFVYTIGDNVPWIAEENFRHVAYHGSKSPTRGMDWSRIRSLTIFSERPTELASSICSQQLRMLRALDLENAQFITTQKDINNVGLLRHLKYLNIGSGQYNQYIYKFPKSIGKLHGLEALDARGTHISKLPTEIIKLQCLRSLRCSKVDWNQNFDHTEPLEFVKDTLCLPFLCTPVFDRKDRSRMVAELHRAYSSHFSGTKGVRVPRGISNLKALQILEVVDLKGTSTKAIKELGELKELRKLSVTTYAASRRKCKTYCEAIQKLPSLRSLCIDAYGYRSPVRSLEWLGSASSLPPLLRSLKLDGSIGVMPDCFKSLAQLVKIGLRWTKLEEDKSIDVLGGMPKLMLLQFYYRAYEGKKLVLRNGAFPSLRKLYIGTQDQLLEIRFEEGASTQMESLEIRGCRLESGINGIKHLPKLKEISLSYDCKVARLAVLQEEVDRHPNQPLLRLQEDRRVHDLGDAEGPEEFFEAVESLPDRDGEGSQASTPTASDSCEDARLGALFFAGPRRCRSKPPRPGSSSTPPVHLLLPLQAAAGFTSHQADGKRQLTSTVAGPNLLRQRGCLVLDACVLFTSMVTGPHLLPQYRALLYCLLAVSCSGFPMQSIVLNKDTDPFVGDASVIEAGIVGHNNKSTDTGVASGRRVK
ncbi:hypothetical protein EJB05_54339 [Eragrostis curvula]|uniref:AAA+ ATPase domain-containing protein n=1 Tax=Eragrostis curvula TaxID=38414 RepID=A0A5J9SML6_9POAL|nr:hypothetical protein EJB05_54339 [Eragrostis curvula]